MKKTIRLTESDLTRIIKRVIKENELLIYIPRIYNGIRMELGKNVNPQDIINLYNELLQEYASPLVDYSEYGTEGMFYNEMNDEIPVDVILDELNYAIVGEGDDI